MVETVTPSEDITAGQIGKIQELLAAALRKSGLPSGAVQQVLETTGGAIVAGWVVTLRTAVEAITKMFSRHVTVDITRTPEEAIAATGRKQYTDKAVVATMPRGLAQEEVHFFQPRPEAYDENGLLSDEALEKEYEFINLNPASAYSLAKANEDDPTLADSKPNGTHWKDAQGKWCFATFFHWGDEREVGVNRRGFGWFGSWWFAGVRKS